jgi:hypothetical protein
MDLDADRALTKYFSENIDAIEAWFNCIAPEDKNIDGLKSEMTELRSKD